MTPRRAQLEDAARLAALGHWVWLDRYAPDGVETRFLGYLAETFTPAVFERLIRDPEHTLWLLEGDGGALQGFAQLRRGRAAPGAACERYDVELERLYVAPPCQGRGLGRILLQAARQTWPAQGLWLAVWIGNEGAQRFYLREAGQVVGETPFILDGEAHANLVFGWGPP
jgi:ribosomal protein S18 acetylase RimI-like enzyme